MVLLAAACTPNELGNHRAKQLGDLSAGSAPRAAFDRHLQGACSLRVPTNGLLQRTAYVQHVTHRSAKLLWTASGQTKPTVKLARAQGEVYAAGTESGVSEPSLADATPRVAAAVLDKTAPLDDAKQYVASFTDLSPATLYCYELRDDGGQVIASGGFRTAPRPGADTPVRFLVLGDIGERTIDQFAVLKQMRRVYSDLGLVTGDVAYPNGARRSYESNFFDVYRDLIAAVPFFPASGNHDYKTDSAETFRQVYALPENGGPGGRERWFSFDYGNIHFVALDTERVGPEQAAWLDADLTRTKQPWKIVYGHKPPYSSGVRGSTGCVADHFGPILRVHGVQLAFWGHDHSYERTKPIEGTTHVVTGSGGVGTRPVGTSSFTAFSQAVAHFVYVEVAKGKLTMWAIDATGQTFDTAVLALE